MEYMILEWGLEGWNKSGREEKLLRQKVRGYFQIVCGVREV